MITRRLPLIILSKTYNRFHKIVGTYEVFCNAPHQVRTFGLSLQARGLIGEVFGGSVQVLDLEGGEEDLMSERSGDIHELGEAKAGKFGCGRTSALGVDVVMGESADCSQFLECGKQGVKRPRGSFGDHGVGVMTPVKVEDDRHHQCHSSESWHKMGRIQKPWRLATHDELRTPDVSCTSHGQVFRGEDRDGVVGLGSNIGWLCDREGELHQKTGELLVLQEHHYSSVEAELRRTTEEIKVARKQRNDAVAGTQRQLEERCDQVYEIEMRLQWELQKARRELAVVLQERDDALKELVSQSTHQQEQVDQIEAELHGELQRTLQEIEVVRKQRDDAVAEKQVQLERQCDVVFEIEMGLQMELRRVVSELESARKQHADAVLEVHLQQEHQNEQVLQIEMELQGKIQMKSEELKEVQKERDNAQSLLELQCDQVTQVEVQLQRDLQQVLDDLHQSAQKLDPCKQNVDHQLDQAREIEETLLLSREKLNCLKKLRTILPSDAKKSSGRCNVRDQKQNLIKTKPVPTPEDSTLKVS